MTTGPASFGRLLGQVQRLVARPLGRPRGAAAAQIWPARAPAPPDLSQPVQSALVTGAGGKVGTLLLPWLRRTGLSLRSVDRRAGPGLPSEGLVERADLRDPAVADRLARGQDAILHLAGIASEASVAELHPDNGVALANLLEAAARHGVGRFVFASSMHVVGLYDRHERLDESSPPRPDSHYAASKLHGEALCRLYAERHGLSITCLRLGHVAATLEEAEPASWISPEDVAQLVEIGFRREAPGLEIFHAVADYYGSPLAPSRAEIYGYRCRRPAEPYPVALARVERMWRNDAVARRKRGATFASGRSGN